MYFLYSLIYSIGFALTVPVFLLKPGKYFAGFKQRLGFLPPFDTRGRKVVWIHCVSVGEANAARPLAERIKRQFPEYSLVVSTTTRTGQAVAKDAFSSIADLVFYFPFDWRNPVRRSLRTIKPSVVLLMETEIWFNYIREAYKSGARIAIVNGRLSERSFNRYAKIKRFMKRVFNYVELALMQDKADATRMMSLGARGSKVRVTGNLKFDHGLSADESALTAELRDRFGITADAPLIIAASTHSPEEKWVLDAFREVWDSAPAQLPRLMIAPRHPERFAEVSDLIRRSGFSWVRRSEKPSARDRDAEVILLDSIGELRAAYPLAEVVFVGGSLIPHGGQSIYEPAAAGRPIVTGAHTANFAAAVEEFTAKGAIIRLADVSEKDAGSVLAREFRSLLADPALRERIGENARQVMSANRGSVDRSLEYLSQLFSEKVRSKYR
jgi:3-deoxy-D-manno-octulosonic-acid transferase